MGKAGENVLVIVPAFNEEKNIAIVIDEIISSIPNCSVLVVNDSSADNTSYAARVKGVTVIDLPCNLGIGGAVQTGFIYAYRNNYDIAIQIDGDGQHIAKEVNKLINVMDKTGCDMVIGSRFLNIQSFKSSGVRRVGIGLFFYLYKLLIKQKITDGTSGFRAYNKRAIEFLSKNYPDDYPEPEAVVLLKKNGFNICEVGVKMRERIHGQSSITPLRAVYYMVKVVISIFFAYFRRK